MAKRNCLFATNDGQFFMARNKKEAREMNANAHSATDADIRTFWLRQGFGDKPVRELCQEIGVSHQTICNWYKRACSVPASDGIEISMQKVSRHKEPRRKVIAEAVRNGADIDAVSLEFNVAKSTVIQYCRLEHVSVSKRGAKMSDEKLVELATGRTWNELSEVTGRSLATLRNRIYRNPQLAVAVRNVMKLKFIKGSKTNERTE